MALADLEVVEEWVKFPFAHGTELRHSLALWGVRLKQEWIEVQAHWEPSLVRPCHALN